MVTAISAKGLITRDKMGSAEPYLKLYLHPDRRFVTNYTTLPTAGLLQTIPPCQPKVSYELCLLKLFVMIRNTEASNKE